MYQRSLSLCSPENSMLLVVDVQERLMPAIDGGESVVFNTRRLLDAARTLGVPVIVTEQYPKGLGPTVSEVAGAIPPGTPVFEKKSFSVCGVEEIRLKIEDVPVPKVVLCGVEGHICVQQTALDLLTLGKDVLLVVDASGSRSARDYEIALRRMESSGVALTSTESIFFEWCDTAEHPKFKTISALAKEKTAQ